MKYVTAVLFVVAVLAAISIVVYLNGSIQSGFDVNSYYRTALFSTTIGPISAQTTKCNYAVLKNNTASFSLKCYAGTILLHQPILTNKTLTNLPNCAQEHSKINSKYVASFIYENKTNT
jgi:hypothetical protein